MSKFRADILLFALGVLLFGAAAAIEITVDDLDLQKIRLSPQSYDFGSRRKGEKVEHTFVLTNPYDQPLRIRSVQRSCGCLVTGTPPDVIQPGESIDLPVRMALDSASERLGSTVTVLFENHPPIAFKIVGEVIQEHPDVVDFGSIRRNAASTKELYLRSWNGDLIQIESLSYDETYFDVTHQRIDADGLGVLIKVLSKPGIPCGHFKQSLEIKTGDAVSPIKKIALTGYVLEKVEFEPDMLLFGTITEGETQTKNLRLTAPYGDSLIIRSIHTSPSHAIQCDIGEIVTTADGIELPVHVKGGWGEGQILNGEVKLKMDVGTEQVVRSLAVYVLRRKE